MRLLAALAFAAACDSGELHWPQFRGPNASGVAADADPPVVFGPDHNVRWSAEVGPGHSSPVVAGDRLFLTTADADAKTLSVVCLDRHTGDRRWTRSVTADAFEKGHPSFHPASSTPAADGDRVVAYFGSYGLLAFSAGGEPLWERRLPLATSFGGNAASPVIADGRVLLYRGTYTDHLLAARDAATGEELWSVPLEEKVTGETACTACPVVSGGTVVAHTAWGVQGFDLTTGRRRWVAKAATTATSTPVLAGDEVLVAAWNKLGEPALRPEMPTFDSLLADHDADTDGLIAPAELPTLWLFHRPDGAEAPMNGGTVRFRWADKDGNGAIDADEWSRQLQDVAKFRAGDRTHGLIAVPLGREGVLPADAVRTLLTEGIPEVPSPLSDGVRAYLLKNGGVLSVVDLATGRRTARVRTGGRGTHYASPVLAGGRLYAAAGDGTLSVLTLGDRPKVLAANRLGDPVYATPAPVGDTLYVRTHARLYAFARE